MDPTVKVARKFPTAFRSDYDQNFNPLQKVSFKTITDGLSYTIFIGEKHVLLGSFGVGTLDASIYNGDYPLYWSRSVGPGYPLAQSPTDMTTNVGFGSYHPGICQFLFGDGSVHAVTNNADLNVMGLLANIADGKPVQVPD